MHVGGQFGSAYFKSIIKDEKEEFGKRAIYEPIEDPNCLDRSVASHAILIIGAKKSPEGGYVYYMDPNDANTPDEGRIYKISYQRLQAGITDTHSMKIKKNGQFVQNRIYGLHADIDHLENEFKKYKRQ